MNIIRNEEVYYNYEADLCLLVMVEYYDVELEAQAYSYNSRYVCFVFC